MKRFYLLLLVVAVLAVPTVLGAESCFIAVNNLDPSYIEVGKVSMQGHFTADLSSLFAYSLWCPSSRPFDAGSVSFTYAVSNSTSNGSNHVGLVNAFNGEVLLGFQDNCYMRQSVCEVEESCIFMTNGTNNTHVASCDTPNFPMANSYDYPICCQLTEICNNGVDDDEDGAIDCADHDCNNLNANLEPEICTGSPLNTSGCILYFNATTGETVYNPVCLGQPPDPAGSTYFYCNYGINDDPNNPPGTPGVCCPVGYYAEWSVAQGRWFCTPTTECGLDLANFGETCEFDYDSETGPWLSSVYTGDPDYWCNSQVPDLYSPGLTPDPRSTGCCLVQKYGAWDYYLDEDNVKIYG